MGERIQRNPCRRSGPRQNDPAHRNVGTSVGPRGTQATHAHRRHAPSYCARYPPQTGLCFTRARQSHVQRWVSVRCIRQAAAVPVDRRVQQRVCHSPVPRRRIMLEHSTTRMQHSTTRLQHRTTRLQHRSTKSCRCMGRSSSSDRMQPCQIGSISSRSSRQICRA